MQLGGCECTSLIQQDISHPFYLNDTHKTYNKKWSIVSDCFLKETFTHKIRRLIRTVIANFNNLLTTQYVLVEHTVFDLT